MGLPSALCKGGEDAEIPEVIYTDGCLLWFEIPSCSSDGLQDCSTTAAALLQVMHSQLNHRSNVSSHLGLVFCMLPLRYSCSARAGASCRVILPQGQAGAGPFHIQLLSIRKKVKNISSQERRNSSFTSPGIPSRHLALHTANVGSQMHRSCCCTLGG